MASPFDQPIRCPIVVGRDAQLSALARAVEQVASGQGQALLITGEAGIGKSRLVVEARTIARQRGWCLVEGHCFEPDHILPYAPLLDLLRGLLAPLPVSTIADLLGSEARDLVKILPELHHWLPDLTPSPALDPAQERRLAIQAFSTVLIRLADQQPILVIIEDLHWSDNPSLDALLYLARRVRDVPLLLLLTYRDDEVTPELSHMLATIDRERLALELRLSRLDHREVGAMVSAIFANAPPVGSRFRDSLHALTDGNPFFIEEILKTISINDSVLTTDVSSDQVSLDDLHIPRSVRDAVQRRVDLLSLDARSLLEMAAVAGRGCDFPLLQRLTGHDEHELLSLVKELIGAQLLVEEAPDRFVFRHALTREAIYTSLLGREQRQRHQSILEALEHLYAIDDEPHVAELAYHSYEAGDWQRALDYASRAGEQAQVLYAQHAAVEQFSRALDAASRLARTPAPRLHRARGLAYDTLGDFDHARVDYEYSLTIAHQINDQRSEWQALLDLGLLWAGRDYRQCGDYGQRALMLARSLDEPRAVAQSLNRVGNWYTNATQPREALPYHLEALSILKDLNDKRGIAETFDLIGMSYYNIGDTRKTADYYQRAADLFRELGDRQGLAWCLTMLVLVTGGYQTDAGIAVPAEFDDALRSGELALQTAREIDWRPGIAFACNVVGMLYGAHGHFDRAFESLRTCIAVSEEIGHRQWWVAGMCGLGHLYVDLLAARPARLYLQPAAAAAQQMSSKLWVYLSTPELAAACLLDHDCDAADAVLDAADLQPIADSNLGGRNCWMVRAEICLARGDAEQALRIADQLISTAPGVTTEQQVPRVARIRGKALTRLGRVEEAELALVAAKDGATALGRPSHLWRAQVALGHLYRQQRRYSEADAAFSEARAIIADLADTVPDPDVRDTFLRKSAALMPQPRQATPRRAAKQAFGGLTAREREVARLIAEGKTNHAIADELIVGEPTIATHVSHILGKLQFTSRTQIAAWAIQIGLLQQD